MVVKKSVPRPYKVAQELSSISTEKLQRLDKRYRHAYFQGYSRGRGDISENRQTGHSDSTGDVVADKEEYRRQVAYAAHKITELCAAFDDADRVLSQLAGDSPDNERVKHRPGEVPHAMYSEDYEAARKHMKRVARQNGRKP